MSEPKQHNLLGGIVAGKVIEVVVEKALDKFANKNYTGLTPAEVPQVTEQVAEAVKQEVQSRVDHVKDREPFYKSRNVWGSIVGIVTAVNTIYVMWNDNIPNTMEDYWIPLGIIVASLTPLYSRYIAKKPLGE